MNNWNIDCQVGGSTGSLLCHLWAPVILQLFWACPVCETSSLILSKNFFSAEMSALILLDVSRSISKRAWVISQGQNWNSNSIIPSANHSFLDSQYVCALRFNESLWITAVVRIKTNFTSLHYETQKAVSPVLRRLN